MPPGSRRGGRRAGRSGPWKGVAHQSSASVGGVATCRTPGAPPRYHVPRLHDVAWLTATLRERSLEDTARLLGCAPQSVRYATKKYGVRIEVNGHALPRAIAVRLDDQEWLARRRAEGATVDALADELGTSPGRVTAAIRAAGLPPLHRNGSTPAFPELYDVESVRAQLATRTRAVIARELGCSRRSVGDAAVRAGVPPARAHRSPTVRERDADIG
jgi:hypothetical protein